MCVSIFSCFSINASAVVTSVPSYFTDINSVQSVEPGIDVRDLNLQQVFTYACSEDFKYYGNDYLFGTFFDCQFDFQNKAYLVFYTSSSVYRIVFDIPINFSSFLITDVKPESFRLCSYNSVSFDSCIFSQTLNNYIYVYNNYNFISNYSGYVFPFLGSISELHILYSNIDIYYNDDIYYTGQSLDPLAMNDDWFDISCEPQLSDDMSFSTTYIDPKGNEQTAADYTLDVTISKTGDMFKDSSYEHLLNYYTQCFMFVSTEPVSERDYTSALNTCTYLHYENRQYYGNVVFDTDYTIKDDVELWTGKPFGDKYVHEPVAGGRSMGVTSYSLISGYVPYAVFSGSKDAHYTVDLNGVPLEAGQTYYITVLAFPMSSTFLRNSDLSSSYPMTSLSFRSSVDDSLDESGNFSPQQLIQEAEDFSGVFVVGKSAAFSLNNLNGYKFVDKSSEFGVDPYTYSDDKLHADKYEDTITDRTDYTKKGNGFTTDTPSPDFVQKSLFGFNSSSGSFNGILSSLKSVVPFYTQVVDCFPDNIQTVLILLVVFPLICILIGVIIAGIKFLISLFTG